MTETSKKTPRPSRLKRLLQLVFAAAWVWAIVAAVRALTPSAPLTLAREAVAEGQFVTAVELYQRHLTHRPEDWDVRTELGLVLAEFDRPRALTEFRKVPPDAESYLAARRQIVWICLASERFKEAEVVLLELTEKTPDDFLPHLQLADMYFREHRAAMALPHVTKSIELNPEHAPAHFLHAELLDDLGRSSEMIAPLQRVIELDLDHYAAHADLAYAFAEAGQSANSRREAEWCLARNSNDIIARRFLAQALRDEGNLAEAMREIETALATAPADLECRLLEAELLLFNERNDEVLERLRPLYQHNASDRRLVALLARAAAATGLTDEAATYRQQIQKLSE